MSEAEAFVHHLVPASQLRRSIGRDGYAPASLATEGFVHCTATRALVLQVAADYYAAVAEPLLVLAIETAKLRAPLRFEAPAPIAGGGTKHLEGGVRFPHLYGALNLDAVAGAAPLVRDGAGFAWPAALGPLAAWLGWSVWRRDDHGNDFEMARDLAHEGALRLVAEYEARGHKQSHRAAPTLTLSA